MRLLRCDPDGQTAGRRNRRRIYQDEERYALILLWEAADRVCRKRLKVLLPILIESMERRHIDLATEIRSRLLSMSAATIDRALRCAREQSGRQRPRSVASALRRSIPVHTSNGLQSTPNSSTSSQIVAQRASKRTVVWLRGKRGTNRRDRHITGKPPAARRRNDRAHGWRDALPPSAADGLDPARSPVCWLCKRSAEDRARHRRACNVDQLCDRLPSLPWPGSKIDEATIGLSGTSLHAAIRQYALSS